MRMFGLLGAFIIAMASGAAAQDAAKKELAPTGKLRAAIAYGPAPSALYVLQDAPGKFRGVSIDLSMWRTWSVSSTTITRMDRPPIGTEAYSGNPVKRRRRCGRG